MSRAIGMLETYGLLPAIEGLDAALKSANVSLRSFSYVSGGLVAWFVEGEVGAVRVAVSAGKAAAERLGKVTSDHVIPRPAGDVADTLTPPERPGGREGGTNIHKNEFPARREKPKPPGQDAGSPAKPEAAPVSAPVRKAELTPKAEPVPEAKPGPENGNPLEARTYSRGELEAMRFNELRSMARRIDGFP